MAPKLRPRSNSEEHIDFEDEEEIPPQILHVQPLTLVDSKILSTLHISSNDCSENPLLGLFLSLDDMDYSSVFGPPVHSPDFIDVYPSNSPIPSDLNSKEFEILSSWFLGCHICDYIILIVNFSTSPELHHSDLLFKFFCLLKQIEKPLYILHYSENYAYSFERTNELIEQAWANDRVLLHEEISPDQAKNAEVLDGIREQMMDNLNCISRPPIDLNQRFTTAVETLIQTSLIICNSRNREILIKSEQHLAEGGICVGATLEPNWNCRIKDEFNVKSVNDRVYVSPVVYSEGAYLKCALKGDFQDESVKVGILPSALPQNFSYSVLKQIEHAFDQHQG